MRRWRSQVAGAMAEAGEAALRQLSAAIAALEFLLQRLGVALEHAVGGDAESVLQLEDIAKVIEQGQSEAGIAAQLDRHTRKSGLQTGSIVSGHDLADALPQQDKRLVFHPVLPTRIAETCGPIVRQALALVEGAQRQKTRLRW